MDTRRVASTAVTAQAINTTNVRRVCPTLPVTCQQPSVGNQIPLDQKRPPATSAKAVSGAPLPQRARSGGAGASTRRPWMVSSPVVPTPTDASTHDYAARPSPVPMDALRRLFQGDPKRPTFAAS
jgi:hypothetical protein